MPKPMVHTESTQQKKRMQAALRTAGVMPSTPAARRRLIGGLNKSMSFILHEQRDADCRLAFELYRKYLDTNKWRIAPSAFALASSEWWFDCNDHRCPHDGRMICVQLGESESADGSTELSMSLRLAGAWQSEEHEIIYSGITAYDLSGADGGLFHGHGDWRYDEFRVDDNKRVLHEIEWGNGARWLIKCRDVEHRYTPDNGEQDGDGQTATRPE